MNVTSEKICTSEGVRHMPNPPSLAILILHHLKYGLIGFSNVFAINLLQNPHENV